MGQSQIFDHFIIAIDCCIICFLCFTINLYSDRHVRYLPLQIPSWVFNPTHTSPPHIAGGLLQYLYRTCVPVPYTFVESDLVQDPHLSQYPHWPLKGPSRKKRINTCLQTTKQTNKQTNTLFTNQWRPYEQNNHIINVYTMIAIMCVWFKTYNVYDKHTDKWHEWGQMVNYYP